ncbi:MAG: NAD-dependent epimerase/dehydratase family protein [Proteobacteria bacterium]|jgi:nucleoside-diphosphate-sugar epimerase|nr:NAD-dependent epimerase/dehydratase family protein [Pseudomonadota bacterium]
MASLPIKGLFLVTGGAGFIGSHTVAALLKEGHRVRVLDDLSTGSLSNLDGMSVDFVEGDIVDPSICEAAMKDCTHVIHLAARANVVDSTNDPIGFDSTNVHGTVMVFESARRANVERVVYASSSAVYGSAPGLPKRESDQLQVESPYAAGKAANELYAQAFSRTLGLSCVGMRYFNVYGPRQDPNGPYAAVIPRFVEFALQNRALTVFGDGEQGRDFVSVHDVARANVLAATTPNLAGLVCNLGSGEMKTINELAATVIEAIVSDSSVVHLDERPGDVRFSVSSIDRATKKLGWTPKTDFQSAMEETIDWYRQRFTVAKEA